jgi:hypothetical protein
MGVTVFIVISAGAIYLLIAYVRSLSSDLYSKRSGREPFPLGTSRASMSVEPIVIPVDEVKIPARLPQVELDLGSIVVQTPQVDRSSEVSPNFTTIPSKIEESALFRSLGLAMFAVSVISVDVAAGTHFSGVGIPFATIGAGWSWYRRHQGKHWLNIFVSVASLAMVFGVFVPILVQQIAPAVDLVAPSSKMSAMLELTLGAISVALQMGLSFHLYNRRILGYCLLTSVILMGVAAGLSQHISFAILLSGFMAIAIPALMLDYRSRLALKPIGIESIPSQGQLPYQHLPWKYLIQLAAISIGLGLIISVFLPNFHFPDLSLKQAGIEQLQTLAQKYKPPNSTPQSPPLPAASNPPPVNQQELASKVFGQPGNNNYPDAIKQENLQLPPELASQLQQFTHQILATSPQPLNSDFDRSTYLAEYLKQHHQDAPPPSNPGTLPPLDPKLIQALITQCPPEPQTCKMVGNKQDIPVVYTSMLRSIGIPARLKMGEQLAQIDPQTTLYPRPADKPPSHTEVYSPNWGWVGVDATPDRPVLQLTAQQQAQLQELLKQQVQPLPSPSATPTPPSNPNYPTPQPDPTSQVNNSSPPPTPPAELPKIDFNPAILKTIVIIIAIIGGIVWYLQRQRQQQQQLDTLPPIERIYRSMIVSLSKTGNSKVPAQTQLEYARSIKNTEHPQIAQVVAEISQLYTAWRYGKQKIDIQQLAKKFQNLQYLQQLAATRKRQRWFAKHRNLLMPGNTPKPLT